MRYRNLNNIPTFRIKAILEDHASRGLDGADYGPVRHELEKIYFERMERFSRYENGKRVKEIQMQKEKEIVQAEHRLYETITEIKECWKLMAANGFSFELVEIPNQIMGF